MADAAQWALTIALRSSVSAGTHHPYVTEGKVVPNGILHADRAEGCRDFGRHLPVWRRISSQTKAAPEANHVGIERNDEPGWRQECPRSEIDRVPAHHPAKKEIEPLACASRRRAGKEVADARTRRKAAICRRQVGLKGADGKRFERDGDIGCGRIVAGYEETLDRPGLAEDPLKDEQERHEIPAANPAMNERIDGRPMPYGVEPTDKCRRVRAHRGQQRFDGIENARDTPERESGGAEADHLAVVRRWISPDDVNGIGGGVDVIEGSIEVLEPILEKA